MSGEGFLGAARDAMRAAVAFAPFATMAGAASDVGAGRFSRPAHGGYPEPVDWDRPLIGGPVSIIEGRAEKDRRAELARLIDTLEGEPMVDVAMVNGRSMLHGSVDAIRVMAMLYDNRAMLAALLRGRG